MIGMKVGTQPNTAQSSSSKQSAFSLSTVKPFAWAGIILIFVLILLPFLMQIITFWKYDTGTAIPISDLVKQQADQNQNLLNLMNTFAAIIGVVFAVFAAVAAGLGVYGFSAEKGFREMESEWTSRLEELKKLQEETQKKSQVIQELYEEAEEKSTTIKDLEIQMKSMVKDVEALQTNTASLRDQLQQNVVVSQAMFNKQLEEFNAIIAHLGKSRNLISNDPRINFNLGLILSRSGDYDRAIELFEITVLIDPGFPEAHQELGLAYRRRGDRYNTEREKQKGEEDYKKAIYELEKAVQQNPQDVEALGVLGGLYRRKGDFVQAMKYYQQAVDADSESSYALGNVASLAWYIGNEQLAHEMFMSTEKAARKRLDTLKSLEPYWDYFDIALAQLVLGETEAAKKSYEKAIELTPSKIHFDSVLHNLSMLKSKNGKHPIPGIDEIIEMIERAR